MKLKPIPTVMLSCASAVAALRLLERHLEDEDADDEESLALRIAVQAAVEALGPQMEVWAKGAMRSLVAHNAATTQ